MGYRISVTYIWLSSPQLAYQRVKLRYERGGHYVDEETVHRRYERGRKNLKDLYLGIADNWQIYDNSNDDIVLISERSLSGSDIIFDEIINHKIIK